MIIRHKGGIIRTVPILGVLGLSIGLTQGIAFASWRSFTAAELAQSGHNLGVLVAGGGDSGGAGGAGGSGGSGGTGSSSSMESGSRSGSSGGIGGGHRDPGGSSGTRDPGGLSGTAGTSDTERPGIPRRPRGTNRKTEGLASSEDMGPVGNPKR